MKTTTKIIAATLALASLAAAPALFAHPGMGMGGPMDQGMGMGPGMMDHGKGMGPGMRMGGMFGGESAAVTAARLSDFKAALKLTAAQEPAWQKFEAVTRQQAEARQAMRAAMQAQVQAGKATADLSAQREAMLKLHTERQAARTELYAVLTPEQKALAEHQPFGRHGRHGRHMAMQTPAK